MEITVNQQTYSVSDGCSLQHMLDAVLQKQAQGIALAVNQEIFSEVSESRKFLRKRKKLKLEVTKLLNHEPVSPDQK